MAATTSRASRPSRISTRNAWPEELVTSLVKPSSLSAAPPSRMPASLISMALRSSISFLVSFRDAPAFMDLRHILNWYSTCETRLPLMAFITFFSKPSFS